MADIGVIGLAVMGSNLARNLARKGHKVAIYNRSYEKTQELVNNYGHEGEFVTNSTLEEFINNLQSPRKIIIMIQAGAATDQIISNLASLLDPGDIIVDGGNSFYKDTIRREKSLKKEGIHFAGIGISGGEEGALNGPSIMPGGSEESYNALEKYLISIAATVSGEPCVTHIGEDGAGHFVKMVHNGIEYADMQFIAEAYDLLKQILGLKAKEISQIFKEWNETELESFLIETTSTVLEYEDLTTGKALVDVIRDKAAQKGTGRWTVQDALEIGISTNTIAEAVFSRSSSGNEEFRKSNQNLPGPKSNITQLDPKEFIKNVHNALYASKLIAYTQGLHHIATASVENNWNIKLSEVAKIWRGGCIIRAKLLDNISNAYANNNELISLLSSPEIQLEISKIQEGWRETVSLAVKSGIPVPGFSSALSYYDTIRAKTLPANLIQGLRDFFGAHTYKRIDKPGNFHVDWMEERIEKEM